MNDALTIGHPRAAGSFRRRKGRALAALAFVIAMPVVVAAAPTPASARPAGLTARANAILEAAYPAEGPGAAVIVTRGDRTLFAAGRGLADIEAGRPVTPDTILGLGSITKQFTAAVILQLVQEGRISLDDPLSRFLPDYPQPGASATVRQLLNHTSGIQSYTSIPGWTVEANMNRAYTTAQMIAVFRDQPSRTPPGQAWAYNNSGYVLLGAIVESVTGKAWHEAIVERIARPLGLRSIGYGEDRAARGPAARAYSVVDGQLRPAQGIHMSVPHGAGGLAGSVRDLARWAQALHHGRVIDPALYAQMTSPATLADGSTQPYGFGIRFDELRGRRTVEHGGAIFGFNSESLYLPAEDLFVAVITNTDSPATDSTQVARRLAALALGEPYREFSRAAVDPETLAPLFGVYRVGEAGVSRRFFSRDGRLFTARDDGGADREVQPAGNDYFFYPDNFTWFRVERRPDGAHVMEMHQNGSEQAELAMRTGDIPVEAAAAEVRREILSSYVGRYETEGPGAEIAMAEGGGLTLQLTNQPLIPLRATSDTEFVIEGVGARIVFHPANGQVNRFVIHQGGRQLEGRRAGR
jgi:CubicO group peptidase (beta-lactamase class C family)